jgi:uncharacterized membrane protein
MQRPLLNRLVFLIALIGMFIAIFLWKMHNAPDDIPCGGSHDCSDIAKSPYSRFPVGSGPPVAALGTFGYVILAMLALARTSASAARGRLFLLLSIVTSLLGTLFSLRLTLYEYEIGKWCKWCVASQMLIALIFFLTLTDGWLSRRASVEPETSS